MTYLFITVLNFRNVLDHPSKLISPTKVVLFSGSFHPLASNVRANVSSLVDPTPIHRLFKDTSLRCSLADPNNLNVVVTDPFDSFTMEANNVLELCISPNEYFSR
jgi:hypothetical protein